MIGKRIESIRLWTEDFARHIDYLHHNSAEHGHAQKVRDWPCSSFHRLVEKIFIPWIEDIRKKTNWPGTVMENGCVKDITLAPGFRKLHPG